MVFYIAKCYFTMWGIFCFDVLFQILQTFMLGCLKEANKHKYSTVAFPAMGTGNLGYPKDVVAKEMFRIVSQYSSKNPKSTVTEVWFVVYEKDHPTIKVNI